jgi:hypothetical protein
MTRSKQDTAAQKQLSQTVKLSDMKSKDFDTIWDLVDNPDSIADWATNGIAGSSEGCLVAKSSALD